MKLKVHEKFIKELTSDKRNQNADDKDDEQELRRQKNGLLFAPVKYFKLQVIGAT